MTYNASVADPLISALKEISQERMNTGENWYPTKAAQIASDALRKTSGLTGILGRLADYEATLRAIADITKPSMTIEEATKMAQGVIDHFIAAEGGMIEPR